MSVKIYGHIMEKVSDGADDVIVGVMGATTDTDGFLYIPAVAGAPSGAPTSRTGFVPICFDSTNGRLYAYYGGAWKYGAITT